MYLITFLPCGTKFLVNQSSEEEALKSAVKANETVGEIEDVDLTLKSLYIIEPADFSTLIQLFKKNHIGETQMIQLFSMIREG